ncbi:DNA gyrase subunit a [Thermoplasma volcanium GSS1]|uniref:DNA topoisomerase (ATP-hydrolyzing) n=1 Tax=Thermoplasma volcanium (strain ATCC 51530 / DSM 4299 / JCM 9571 / NBRC 15438 / GSS1) TaxID=273116 RepID=Q97BB5_THEVO|nr:DNA gyrase subunit A [Thermoplasma volcanium]BAB59684.1 DNA gyrase subunit a [Thermoplasma volcanium GSS1]
MEKRPVEVEIKKSYLEYAMSVIVSRAIPDARDGLKPVQRRVLYAMRELNVTHDKPYKKCARIVGETMGKYHPHGDMAIYDALVRMAQDFSLRYPLVDGQGNFGSIDGDSPAAMRYTEARLTQFAEDMMEDIDEETVNFRLNFDGTLPEPEYLPSKVPNLLVNGSSGIAVGMATNMVPHNLSEISDAIKYELRNRSCSVDDLLKIVKGPDFPGGGIVFYSKDLIEAYRTGKGKVIVQGEVDTSEERRIIIKSLPYGVNKSVLVESIANLAKNGIIKDITDIKDESDRNGIRIVIRVRDEDLKPLVMNQLYEHTDLETTIGIINLVLVGNQPKLLNLKQLLDQFIDHRLDVILKRSRYRLEKKNERHDVLSGVLTAIDNIDRVVEIVRGSDDVQKASETLKKTFNLNDRQVKAILEMRLQRLVHMERESVVNELKSIEKEIADLKEIIESEQKRIEVLEGEIDEIKKRYGDKRRTKIKFKEIGERSTEDLIPNEESVIMLSYGGLVKRVPIDEYRSQRRGGKGVNTSMKISDTVKSIIHCFSHDTIYFFTSGGRVFKIKAYEIPKKSRTSLGVSAGAFLKLQQNERVTEVMKAPADRGEHLVLVTRNGFVKKTPADPVFDAKSSGLKIITLDGDDELVSASTIDTDTNMFVLSSKGKGSVFNTSEVRETGRSSMGVRSMRLGEEDYVVTAFVVKEGQDILSISEKGFGKRTNLSEFPVHHRGSGGVLVYRDTERTGKISQAIPVKEDDEVIIVSMNEKTIRIKASEIPETSRVTSGVKLIDLEDGDRIMAVAVF